MTEVFARAWAGSAGHTVTSLQGYLWWEPFMEGKHAEKIVSEAMSRGTGVYYCML